MPEDKNKEQMIDLPSDGPDTEVILPEETVKEGAQNYHNLQVGVC